MSSAQRSAQGAIVSLMRRNSRERRRALAATRNRPEPMPNATVLLVMDFQKGVADRFGDAVLGRAVAAAQAAREAGVPVVFVRVAFRAGHPEISPANRTFAAARDAGRLLENESPIVDELAVRPDEPVVTKRRVGAFSGSDLDVVLRAYGAQRLVLAGIATSGVVLSTLRRAADLDFELVVLRDACGDDDQQVHDVLMDKVFPRQAEVTDVATWAASLKR